MKNRSFVAVLVSAGLAVLAVACTLEKGYAEEQAREYATELGMDDAKVTCVNSDSNNDGYVSCTIMHDGKLQPIECGAYRTGCFSNHGCRIPRAKEGTQ